MLKVSTSDSNLRGDARNAQSSSSTTGTQPSWGATTGGQPGLDRHAQQAYYAPRASYDTPAQGYDTYSNVASSRNTAPSPAGASSPASRPLSPPSDPATGTPPPPSTGSGRPNIDPGKIGLLPKRPVSLLNTTDAQPSGRLPDDDDSDELDR
ncbi:hypothetical protein BV25DRAFT_1487159 [Artomyces pyxidatus]|uniref:Uncharacterized protein n=1 Tax=Artomyces pyxidatus TaxID=48021 RepID=A0ACB8TBU3_9AGAM|nr:hypothetical protein BV25DRAFT_1487159 [Artomyces pyxidatus]